MVSTADQKIITFNVIIHQVRQGLKTYSNWPTYPQVYVKGELIGGLDIITVGVIEAEKINVITIEVCAKHCCNNSD